MASVSRKPQPFSATRSKSQFKIRITPRARSVFSAWDVASRAACSSCRILSEKGASGLSAPEKRSPESGNRMSGNHPISNDELRPEYDFSEGVRGKHHQQYKAGTNVV